MSSVPIDIASAIQSASIKRHPSPHHDLNPSTAASSKQPVKPASPTSPISSNADSIPESALKPVPRRTNLPPLPDMRFEQSYLASLQGAESYWRIAWITGRDQVFLPLVQGMLWTFLLSGWRYWNRGAQFQGASLGSKVRRWWWGVNNWKLPEETQERVSEKVGEFYTAQFGGHD
ncbi:MAG: hypothetical protein L6R40_001653 [Gallowayella cf. fulva]|nr:MAG: hypothetical protein L6R40_001653 [Xanthomendoza cf. fulva]